MENYDKLVLRIANASKLSVEEIDRKVEAKRAKLSGLVSKEGAAQIVAAELDINLEKERLKISEVVNGMKKANTLGKILSVSPVREFNKNGRAGKVCNLLIADEGSNVKVVLWDTNHISLFETGKIAVGDVVEVSSGNVRDGEIHLGSFSDIKKSNEIIGNVVEVRSYGMKKIGEFNSGDKTKTRAFIVQAFEPRYFEVCPECGKKALEGGCAVHGKVEPKKRALLNVVLDDGSGTIRAVLFGEQINKIGLSDEEIFSLEKFEGKKLGLLGEERIFSGNVRTNNLYNNTEFYIEGVEEVKVDELIKELEVAGNK